MRPLAIPAKLLHEKDINYTAQVNKYYSEIIMCITSACKATIPYTARGTSFSDLHVPGWNDIVKDKHHAATVAFLDWVAWQLADHAMVLFLCS